MSVQNAPEAATDVFALLRSPRASVEYPRVAPLLAEMTGADLTKAGRLLARLDLDTVLAEHPGTPTLTVAITGHGTLSTLVPSLTAEVARHGILLRPRLSEFDSYVFDLAGPHGRLQATSADLTLCVLDPMIVFDDVPAPWRPEDVQRVFDEKLRLLEQAVRTFQNTGQGGTLVLNTIPLPRQFPSQLIDHRSRGRLGALWRAANTYLLELADDHENVVVIDLDPLVAEGVRVTDPRLSSYAKAHLTADLLAGYARDIGHLARHITGRTKKCLILDLDGTLWGGVLGEDGVEGVEVSEGYRGEAFRAFQRVAKQIGSQGVLLAVVSKNELDSVRAALRDRQDMTLREDDFVHIVSNWRPKHDNLAELATTLNLGVDSFVFIDDNAAECGLVRRALPGVAVISVDDEPALHVQKLLADGWFDTRELTTEDRARVAIYRNERVRKDFLDRFDSVQDYLRELSVTVRLTDIAERDIARISQLTLRTNQFNLTTRRLQQAEVRQMLTDPTSKVLAVRASDRFGSNGLVGAVFLSHEENVIRIDNFVLSCRVFSRGIEQGCMAAVLGYARRSGADIVLGTYRPSAKNGVVKDFYPRYGFEQVAGEPANVVFEHDLREIVDRPDHLSLHEDFLGGAA